MDLKKSYETFKTFMCKLIQMYLNVKDDAYLLFFCKLEWLAKVVSTLFRTLIIFYSAHEIADNQAVVAIFAMQFTNETFEKKFI